MQLTKFKLCACWYDAIDEKRIEKIEIEICEKMKKDEKTEGKMMLKHVKKIKKSKFQTIVLNMILAWWLYVMISVTMN